MVERIAELRELGAVQVQVGELVVTFVEPTPPEVKPPRDESPEDEERRIATYSAT